MIFCNASLVSMSQSSLNYQLLQAAKEGTAAVVQTLILKGADVLAAPSIIAYRHEIPLMVALNAKNDGACRVLVNYRFNEQAKSKGLNGYSLIHYVAGNHYLELVEPLLKLGVSINDRNNVCWETPLLRAIDSKPVDIERQLEMIRQLLVAGANPYLSNCSEEDAFTVAGRQPFPIKEKILDILNTRRD